MLILLIFNDAVDNDDDIVVVDHAVNNPIYFYLFINRQSGLRDDKKCSIINIFYHQKKKYV